MAKAKAPYGSAPMAYCTKCTKEFSKTNFSKHVNRCKGLKPRASRSEIRKKSWQKHRAKRVDSQRCRRATKAFKKLQGLCDKLQELQKVSLPPKPAPVGMKYHPFER